MELVFVGIGAFFLLIMFGSERVHRFFQPPEPNAVKSRTNHPWVRRGAPIPERLSHRSIWSDKNAGTPRGVSSVRAWSPAPTSPHGLDAEKAAPRRSTQ